MRLILLTVFVFISFSMSAQETYSYINERTFKDPTDLIGYNFKPFKMEVPGDYDPTMIEAGEYSFGVTRGRLYVNGSREIAGLYEVNNIEPTNYGYRILLLNSRNPSNRGHLKIILNKYGEAEAVVFKKESKAHEVIFHLPDAKKSVLDQEKKYFTDLGEMVVEHSDSLWGQKIFPYIRVDQKASFQGRLYEADSTIISFEEVITIKEKKKKKKKKKAPKVKKPKKKKRKKRKEKVAEEEEEWGSLAEMNGENEEEKVAEVVEEVEAETTPIPVEEVQEKIEEEVTEVDEAAAPAVPQPEEEEVVVKRKITKEYFVKIKTILKKEDGTTEEKTWSYPVKEIQEKEDSSARKNEERFQLEIKSKGKKELYLYLYGDRTVSSMEIDGVKYLMRGH